MHLTAISGEGWCLSGNLFNEIQIENSVNLLRIVRFSQLPNFAKKNKQLKLTSFETPSAGRFSAAEIGGDQINRAAASAISHSGLGFVTLKKQKKLVVSEFCTTDQPSKTQHWLLMVLWSSRESLVNVGCSISVYFTITGLLDTFEVKEIPTRPPRGDCSSS